MSNIVMTSAPFCYGPTSKLLYVAEELQDDHTLIYVGTKHNVLLAKSFGFKKIIEINDRDKWNLSSIEALRKSDLLLTFLDCISLKVAKYYEVPSVFFDTLSWYRTELPPNIEKACMYISQKFFKESSITSKLSCDIVEVGPIISRQLEVKAHKKNSINSVSILVNVGGLHSPVMQKNADNAYLDLVIEIIKKSNIETNKITLCLPKYLKERKQEFSYRLYGAEIAFLNTQQFQERLLNATLLITQPGLEVVLEAMYCEVPIVFLPPHNATQVFQAEIYSKMDIYMLYLKIGGEKYLRGNKFDLDEITSKLQRFNIEKCFDTILLQKLSNNLSEILEKIHSDSDFVRKKCCRNKALLLSLGKSGRKVTANYINKILKS